VKNQIKRLLASLGYEVRGTRMTPRQLLQPDLQRALEFEDIICRRMYDVGAALTFVQIGAFDGVLHDPLRKYIEKSGWRGVMVEPQVGPAQRLRELYRGNERIAVLQAAVSRQAGARAFYTVDSSDAPAWAGALASFDKDVILKHSQQIPGLAQRIKETAVDCVTFDTILQHLPAGNLDLLQVDTEGADAEILSLFPFERVKPAIVHWEVCHLTLREREECLALLAGHGYRFSPSGDRDMLAVIAV
jgi:FkbM family methyltransferase